MIEKDRRSIKYIRKKNMARGMTGQRGRDGLGTEKRKFPWPGFLRTALWEKRSVFCL